MNYALMIYTVVAMTGQNSFSMVQAHDWRTIANFSSVELCNDAAHSMGISSERYRCVRTSK
jgi:hypothetical protein